MKPLPILIVIVALGGAAGIVSWLIQPNASEAVVINERGQASGNPFTVPETGPYPKVVLDEETYDFGKMVLGSTQNHPFVIRNEGEAPLKLQKGFITCKCTVPTIPDEGIPPGESAEIVMEWKPLTTTDSFDKYAEVWTNDPENPKIRLTITGEVRDLMQVQPESPWTVSTVYEEQPTTFSGAIGSGKDEFKIVSLETSADWLTVEPAPISADELAAFREGISSGYTLNCEIRPEMTVGRFQEKITITTDLEEGHTLTIPVNGTRPGPFSIIGKAWYGREMTVTMGNVAADEGKSEKLSLFTDTSEEPLELTSVTADPDIVQVTLKRDETFPAKAKEKYDITFTLSPGCPAGRYIEQNQIAITLKTNRKVMDEIELSIDATVE